jgi:aryl-alcohol dehydrogenase-like predicted oxidoreductase
MEEDYLPLFHDEGLGTTIWSPLASGVLSGKYMNGTPSGTRTEIENFQFIKDRIESKEYKPRHEKVKELSKLSHEIGIPLVNLALCWCLKNSNVSTVILGASKEEQLKQNLQSIDYLDLMDESVMLKIASIINIQ